MKETVYLALFVVELLWNSIDNAYVTIQSLYGFKNHFDIFNGGVLVGVALKALAELYLHGLISYDSGI